VCTVSALVALLPVCLDSARGRRVRNAAIKLPARCHMHPEAAEDKSRRCYLQVWMPKHDGASLAPVNLPSVVGLQSMLRGSLGLACARVHVAWCLCSEQL
jgi:hypothetical protein